MLTHVFIHPGNPNLIELFALLAGFFLLLFTIDLALGFIKRKSWKRTAAGGAPPVIQDSDIDPQ